MPVYDAWDQAEATAIVTRMARGEGPLLPMLHALLDRFGHVDHAIIPEVAEALNLSRAEILGTISFYHEFRAHPPGRHVIKLCRAEACQSRGSNALQTEIKALLGVDWHGTTSDGAITLEPVFCLGLCANAPAALVDGEPEGHLDSVALRAIVAEARA